MKINTVLIIIYLAICNLTFAQNLDERLVGLDEEIETLVAKYNAVGLAVAIVENDAIIYSNGFGFRNREDALEMNAETLLPIGSVSKSFTASLLGILEDEGKLSLLDKPSDYIPKLKFYNEKMDNLITIEDLLCHKSGMGNFDGSITFFPTENPIDFVPRLKYMKPNGEIKNSFLYSNAGYGLSGLIIEQVNKKSWESSIKSELFEPMEMYRSVTNIPSMEKDGNHGIGYGLSEGKQVKLLNRNFTFSKAEGAIISSVNEMSHYMMAWMNKGKYNNRQIIPEQYVNKASTIKNIRPQNNADSESFLYGYGYGWFIQSFKGHYNVEHGGNVPGFSTQLSMYPNEKIGIIVITNQNNSALPYLVEDVITNRMLDLERKPVEEYEVHIAEIWNKLRNIKPINSAQPPTHKLEEYSGIYKNEGYGEIEILEVNDMLHIVFPDYTFVLEHQNFNNFIMVNTEEIPEIFGLPFFGLSFQISYAGKINSLTLGFQRDPVFFERQ